MDEPHTRSKNPLPSWALLITVVVAIVVGGVALGAVILSHQAPVPVTGSTFFGGMGAGPMGGRGPATTDGIQPGEAGFVAGTSSAPRVVQVLAGPGYEFSPTNIPVAPGETVTFVVTAVGPTVHEFMVGPADAVAADASGTPEIADIAMMRSESLTYTFDGPGPFAFACHADGHYEAGMHGTITLVG